MYTSSIPPGLRTKFRSPGKVIEVSPKITPAITELRTLSWYQKCKFIVLNLNNYKADTMNFSCNIITKTFHLLLIICQNTLHKTSGMFIFAPIPSQAVQQTFFFPVKNLNLL